MYMVIIQYFEKMPTSAFCLLITLYYLIRQLITIFPKAKLLKNFEYQCKYINVKIE